MKKGWEIKRLGEIFTIKPPKSEARLKVNGNEKVSFVPMEDLGILTKDFLVDKEKIMSEVIGSYTYFADEDVLMAKITPCFENGKLGIAKKLKNGIGFGSSEYIVFRKKTEVISEYLYYFLSQPIFR